MSHKPHAVIHTKQRIEYCHCTNCFISQLSVCTRLDNTDVKQCENIQNNSGIRISPKYRKIRICQIKTDMQTNVTLDKRGYDPSSLLGEHSILLLLQKLHEICSTDSHENNYNCCHQMSVIMAKMHRIRFWLGLRTGPRRGSLQRSQTS